MGLEKLLIFKWLKLSKYFKLIFCVFLFKKLYLPILNLVIIKPAFSTNSFTSFINENWIYVIDVALFPILSILREIIPLLLSVFRLLIISIASLLEIGLFVIKVSFLSKFSGILTSIFGTFELRAFARLNSCF